MTDPASPGISPPTTRLSITVELPLGVSASVSPPWIETGYMISLDYGPKQRDALCDALIDLAGSIRRGPTNR